MNVRFTFGLVMLMTLAGCASTSVRPPSPARDMPLEGTLVPAPPTSNITSWCSAQAVGVPRSHTGDLGQVTSNRDCVDTISTNN